MQWGVCIDLGLWVCLMVDTFDRLISDLILELLSIGASAFNLFFIVITSSC